MKMNTEIEIKLSIKADIIPKFKDLPIVMGAVAHEVAHLHSDYFDTQDHFLRRNGYVLRIRNKQGIFIQTIKNTTKSKNGVHERQEWEIELATEQPDFTQLPCLELQSAILKHGLLKKIGVLFSTIFTREDWLIQYNERTQVQLSLDRGYVKANQMRFPICEVELELVSGDKADLEAMAKTLMQTLNLSLINGTKAGCGYRMHADQVTLALES